ncbi:MAG: lamin tail domain-containing protein [Planctomycetota bacterium]|nr:lamin tail domain-containing protein [Planctomycetota bacterium]
MIRRLLSLPLVPLLVVGFSTSSILAQGQVELHWLTAADGHGYLEVQGAPALGQGLLRIECSASPGEEALVRQLPLALEDHGQFRLPLSPGNLAGLSWRLSVRAWGPAGASGGAQTSGPLVLGPGFASGPRAYQSGEVLITEFQRNPAEVSDSRGEWLELQNMSDQVIDIEGWTLADDGSDVVTLTAGGAGIPMLPNQCLVFGNELDRSLNGNVFVQYDYGAFHLSNSADEIVLLRPDGTLVDRVAYDAAGSWPAAAGRSAALSWDTRDPFANDLGQAWCSSDYIYDATLGDRGSPTRANGNCP